MARREKDLNKKWIGDVDRLRTIINTAITSILDCSTTTSSESAQLRDKLKAIQITATEMEIHKALGKYNICIHIYIRSELFELWSRYFRAVFIFFCVAAFSEIHILEFYDYEPNK